jgi:hypothetical protein
MDNSNIDVTKLIETVRAHLVEEARVLERMKDDMLTTNSPETVGAHYGHHINTDRIIFMRNLRTLFGMEKNNG